MLRLIICAVPWVLFYGWCLSFGRREKDWKSAPVRDAVIAILGYAGAVAACAHSREQTIMCIVTATLTAIVLAASSREDMRSGQFYIWPLAACLTGNSVVAFWCSRSQEGTPPLNKEAFAVIFILIALRIGKLAVGDCFIYVTCWLSFRILFCEQSFLAFFLMLFVSTVLGIATWTVRLICRKGFHTKFPFTAQIASGCLVTYLLSGYFVAAGIGRQVY